MNSDDLHNLMNKLLASAYVLYLKTQAYHWNVTGPQFGSYHILFEKQYEDLAMAVDEIAERIREMGHPVVANLHHFSNNSGVADENTADSAAAMLKDLISGHETICDILKKTIHLAQELQDDVTVDILTDRLTAHEKHLWMLSSSR